MLVLSRKRGDRIIIGGNIVVEVLGFQKGRVRLGVEAPRIVPVRRTELSLRLNNERDGRSASGEVKFA